MHEIVFTGHCILNAESIVAIAKDILTDKTRGYVLREWKDENDIMQSDKVLLNDLRECKYVIESNICNPPKIFKFIIKKGDPLDNWRESELTPLTPDIINYKGHVPPKYMFIK